MSDLHEESMKLLCELYQLYHSDRRVLLHIFNSMYVYTFIVQISNQFLKHIFVSNGPCVEIC